MASDRNGADAASGCHLGDVAAGRSEERSPDLSRTLGLSREKASFGELGYRIPAGRGVIEPFANLAYVNKSRAGFIETAGLAALGSRGADTGVGFTTLGLDMSTDFTLGGAKMFARGTFGWRHAFGDVRPASALAFAETNNPFSVGGVSVQPNAATPERKSQSQHEILRRRRPADIFRTRKQRAAQRQAEFTAEAADALCRAAGSGVARELTELFVSRLTLGDGEERPAPKGRPR